MVETCANCGHDFEEHKDGHCGENLLLYKNEKGNFDCSCKKFVLNRNPMNDIDLMTEEELETLNPQNQSQMISKAEVEKAINEFLNEVNSCIVKDIQRVKKWELNKILLKKRLGIE